LFARFAPWHFAGHSLLAGRFEELGIHDTLLMVRNSHSSC
jgi:hypothetical protein